MLLLGDLLLDPGTGLIDCRVSPGSDRLRHLVDLRQVVHDAGVGVLVPLRWCEGGFSARLRATPSRQVRTASVPFWSSAMSSE
jgi:hypothetical protein